LESQTYKEEILYKSIYCKKYLIKKEKFDLLIKTALYAL